MGWLGRAGMAGLLLLFAPGCVYLLDIFRGSRDPWKAPPEPAVEGNPVHDSLSAASPENPVYLTHASGHASFVNARAMELAGIDAESSDPPGGELVRDDAGKPTADLSSIFDEVRMT